MKFKSSVFVLITLILAAPGLTQYLYKSFQLEQEQPEMRLASNSITDIVIAGETVWFGTGNGLSKTGNAGLDFLSYKHEQGIGRGGVSALAVSADIVWVAAGFDSLTALGSQQTGGGLAYSLDNGDTWQFVEQPGVTPVQNITFDIALRDDEVWITSFGGGLRKSDDLGQEWKIIPPDSFIFDPFARLNHRAFSVLNADGVLWVDTAGGINRSL